MDISLAPNILTTLWGFPITNTFWVVVVISVLLILIFRKAVSNAKKNEVPKGIHLWLELIVEGVHDFIYQTTNSKKATNRLLPFLLTIMFIFLMGNLLSYLPGLGTVTYNGMPIYRTATADYNLVFVMTLFFMTIIQAVSITTGGIIAYFKKFINLSSPLNFFIGLLDIIGEVAKIISLSFRFFGNVFAGEVLIGIITFLLPYVAPVPFFGLGLLSSLIQPVVFIILILIYVQMAVVEEEVQEEIAHNHNTE